MRCPSCWAKEKWNPKTPDGMGWAHSERLLPWSSAFESLQESCGSLFSCKSSRGTSYKVSSVTYVACFLCDTFWTWNGRRKRERSRYLWKLFFYHFITFSSYYLQFPLFMSFFCFLCLFIFYVNNLHALVNFWSKYCSALNGKLNLNPFEKLLVGDCGHKLNFPHPPFFAYVWHRKVGKPR